MGENNRNRNNKENVSSMDVLQNLNRLLIEEFESFREVVGCEADDHHEASIAIVTAIRYLRAFNDNRE